MLDRKHNDLKSDESQTRITPEEKLITQSEYSFITDPFQHTCSFSIIAGKGADVESRYRISQT